MTLTVALTTGSTAMLPVIPLALLFLMLCFMFNSCFMLYSDVQLRSDNFFN